MTAAQREVFLVNLQDEGHSLYSTECNRKIVECRKATPEEYRHLFRSYIRHTSSGYLWGWILK